MEVLYPRCAGLDVHKDSVVACVRITDAKVIQNVETFGTTTTELYRLSEWLNTHDCSHVAMEATGVYWKPVWHILEESFELILVNAKHFRNVPGRKTDVNDAMWLADLLAHGLVRKSFVPERHIQELRALTRTRKQLVREKTQHVQRIEKVLQDANLKISSVVSDLMGKSGRAILEALIAGQRDPNKLLAVTTGRLRAKRESLLEALCGHLTDNHRFLLKLHLGQFDSAEQAIGAIDKEVESHLLPFRKTVELLTTIPGVSETAAQVLVSEIGLDMSRFPSAGHLISWAGLCPRNDESAGKRRSTRVRHGAPWLKTLLVQTAWAAARTKGTYLQAQFLRLKSRRGPKKAILAVAASMLTAVYYIIRDQVPYKDLGANYFDHLDASNKVTRLVRKLQSFGYQVELKTAA